MIWKMAAREQRREALDGSARTGARAVRGAGRGSIAARVAAAAAAARPRSLT